MGDQWTHAIERIKAERERREKILTQRRLRRLAIKREAELQSIRALMRP